MEAQQYISLGSFAFTVLVALFGAFRYITVQVDTVRREIGTTAENLKLLLEKEAEKQSKARHDSNNAAQVAIASVASEVKQLQRETVRQDQMKASEDRMLNLLNKIENKVDKLADGFAKMATFEATLTATMVRLDKIATRFNTPD